MPSTEDVSARIARPETTRGAIAGLAAPLLLSSITSIASDAIDLAVIGHYSTDALTAVAGSIIIFEVFSNILSASVMAHRINAARALGANDRIGAGRSLVASGKLVALVSLVGVVVMLFVARPVATAMLGDARIAEIGFSYLVARSLALVLTAPTALITSSAAANRQTSIGLVVTITTVLVNIVLEFPLVFGWGPLPPLGALGDGLSTSIAVLIGLLVALLLTRRRGVFDGWQVRGQHVVLEVRSLSDPARTALPAMASAAVDYLGSFTFFFIVAAIGAQAVAASRIAYSSGIFAFGIVATLGAATMITLSRMVGQESRQGAPDARRSGRQLILVVTMTAGLIIVVTAPLIARIFTSDEEIVATLAPMLRLVGVTVPIIGINTINVAVLRAFKATKIDMYINIITVWLVQVPVALLLVFVRAPEWLLIAPLMAYWIVRACASWIYARRQFTGWSVIAA